MRNFLSKFKIPTILGLALILAGIITGVFLTLRQQIFTSQASADITPQDITLSNISDSEVSISWQTSQPVNSFITFGQTNPNEQTTLDDKDTKLPNFYSIHYVTLKNLLPKTIYQYKIISGKSATEVSKFETATPISSQTSLRPIIGSVLDGDQPLSEGLVYLSIASAITQSSVVKISGNFLIPLSQVRKTDLSGIFPLAEDTLAKLTIISPKGQASALFKLSNLDNNLPPIKLGENLDLTTNIASPSPSPSNEEIDIYDLNSDGKINAADNAIILQNFGKNFKNKKADLNGDNLVNQKDLDLMAKQINQ